MAHEAIKPTHKAVKDYYAAIKALRAAGGKRETELRAAFQELLGKLARQRGWVFMPERPITRDGKRIVPDGTMLDEGVPMGHWEAKDGQDKLAVEAQQKIKKGYPTDNIIFEDTHQAIHYQGGIELKTKNLYDPAELCLLLNQFFAYEKPVQQTFKQALNKFREDVPVLAQHLQDALKTAHEQNGGFKKAFADFFDLCRTSLNPSITQGTVDEMLVQHLLTERIFRKVFHQEDFTRRNVIANEVEKVIDALKAQEFDRSKFLKNLDYFYKAIEAQAADLGDYSEKQELLNTVYERFFQGYSVKVADTHGIVYTPQAIVDFMCASVEEVLQKEFGTSLGGKDVHILDPCTGTGNFIVNLIRRIPRGDLERVYKQQLFANEIMLLPYYIAALNIEHAYWERTGEYESFEGLCFVDTLELAESKQKGLGFMTKANAQRVERQRKAPITVIIGNPPYNANQVNETDNNRNRAYEVLDQRIRDTYADSSTATLKNKLYDPYLKFFRWAADRLGEREGVVCFISNNNFVVDGGPFDGVRAHLLRDFTQVLHIDLMGNARTGLRLSGSSHNVFGIPIGVGVTICVRSQRHKAASVLYCAVPEVWRKDEKLAWLNQSGQASKLKFKKIKPTSDHVWIAAEGAELFDRLCPLLAEGQSSGALFGETSVGVKTNRDEVVYDFNEQQLLQRMEEFASMYNTATASYVRERKSVSLDKFVLRFPLRWDGSLKQRLEANRYATFDPQFVRVGAYRPFTSKPLYFDWLFINRTYRQRSFYPNSKAHRENVSICCTNHSQVPFSALATMLIPNEAIGGRAGHCFPFYVYDEDGSNRRENVTDWALKTFREAYGDKTISKWDIFHYFYAMLHHPGYREKFKDCLKRELPRIPFAGFGSAGAPLAGSAGVPPASAGGPAPAVKARARCPRRVPARGQRSRRLRSRRQRSRRQRSRRLRSSSARSSPLARNFASCIWITKGSTRGL